MSAKGRSQGAEARSQKPEARSQNTGPVHVGIADVVPVTIHMTKMDKEQIKRALTTVMEMFPPGARDVDRLFVMVDKLVRTFEGGYK